MQLPNNIVKAVKRHLEDVFRNSARTRRLFLVDVSSGMTVAQAKRSMHSNTAAMFMHMYGSTRSFFANMESGSLCGCQDQRKVPINSDSVRLCQQLHQLPTQCEWLTGCNLQSKVDVEEAGSVKQSWQKEQRRMNRKSIVQKAMKRRRGADQRLARADPEFPGAVDMAPPVQFRRSGPMACNGIDPHLPSPAVDARTKEMIDYLTYGQDMTSWESYHLALAISRAWRRYTASGDQWRRRVARNFGR